MAAACRSAGINPCSDLAESQGQGYEMKVSPQKQKLLRNSLTLKCFFFALHGLLALLCQFRFYIFLNDALLICQPPAFLPPEVGAIVKSSREFLHGRLPISSFPVRPSDCNFFLHYFASGATRRSLRANERLNETEDV